MVDVGLLAPSSPNVKSLAWNTQVAQGWSSRMVKLYPQASLNWWLKSLVEPLQAWMYGIKMQFPMDNGLWTCTTLVQ